ncbi:chemotaxis-related protein [Beggiatoa sp. PS]|nr:chemotaxis-related protein [Beggiatoa sp. PS]
MPNNDIFIRCLLIPIGEEQLLLPSAIIAEITSYSEPTPITKQQPDWLLGNIDWRNKNVPLLAVENILSLPTVSSDVKYHTVILYGLENLQRLPFYGFRITEMPRSFMVTADSLLNNQDAKIGPGLAYQVNIHNTEKTAWLPDLDYLENLLSQFSSPS